MSREGPTVIQGRKVLVECWQFVRNALPPTRFFVTADSKGLTEVFFSQLQMIKDLADRVIGNRLATPYPHCFSEESQIKRLQRRG